MLIDLNSESCQTDCCRGWPIAAVFMSKEEDKFAKQCGPFRCGEVCNDDHYTPQCSRGRCIAVPDDDTSQY